MNEADMFDRIPEVFDVLVIGCFDKNSLCRYENDQVMHALCDVVIAMVDSSYWEVFSKKDRVRPAILQFQELLLSHSLTLFVNCRIASLTPLP